MWATPGGKMAVGKEHKKTLQFISTSEKERKEWWMTVRIRYRTCCHDSTTPVNLSLVGVAVCFPVEVRMEKWWERGGSMMWAMRSVHHMGVTSHVYGTGNPSCTFLFLIFERKHSKSPPPLGWFGNLLAILPPPPPRYHFASMERVKKAKKKRI